MGVTASGTRLSRKAIYTIVYLVVAASILVVSCNGGEKRTDSDPRQVQHLSLIRYTDIRDPNAAEVRYFKAGETPAVRIVGCGGQSVLFSVIQQTTNRAVRMEKVVLPYEKTIHWPLPDLAPGPYVALLKVPGLAVREKYDFTVGVWDISP